MDNSSSSAGTSRPSSLRMLQCRTGRAHTVSIALPASIIQNAQSGELKAMLVGQIARAATIYSVDEIVVYEDQSDAKKSDDAAGASRGLAFFCRNLEYLETPQYLRRQLVPMHPDLRWVGLLSPLDAPHHLRKYERLQYREGAVVAGDHKESPPDKSGTGSWVNCGLDSPVWVDGQQIPVGVRVTVQLQKDEEHDNQGPVRATAVAPREPTTKAGLYWGYQTRIAKTLSAVFDECPFDEGYDLTIGTSERGEVLGVSKLPNFRHLLIVFGGLGGLEEAVADEMSGYDAGTTAKSLFNRYINICPSQTSRTIRTEEALLITLAALSPHLPQR